MSNVVTMCVDYFILVYIVCVGIIKGIFSIIFLFGRFFLNKLVYELV